MRAIFYDFPSVDTLNLINNYNKPDINSRVSAI